MQHLYVVDFSEEDNILIIPNDITKKREKERKKKNALRILDLK